MTPLTISEVAQQLGVTVSAIRQRISAGRLAGTKQVRNDRLVWLLDADSVEQWQREREARTK